MKYLAGLMLLMLAHVACAAQVECQLNGSVWYDVQTHGFTAYVEVAANKSINKVLLNQYVLNCRQTWPDTISPVLTVTTASDAVRFHPQYSHLRGGLVTSTNSYYPTPVQSGVLLGKHVAGPYVRVISGVYLDIVTTPGKYIEIKDKSLIATVNLEMRLSSVIFPAQLFTTFINIHADNKLNLSPSTCTINDDKPIEVDFGSVDPVAIPESPYDSTNSRAVALNYSCPDLGITTPIHIILQGSGALFNLGGLATSNTDLAVRMVRNNGGVPVGLPFATSITNSSGGDTVVFSLFRKPGSVPAAGPFTASGTLVMSVP